MNTKSTWILSIAAILMLLYILIFERSRQRGKNESAAPEALQNFDPAAIDKVQVTVGTNSFEADRAGDGWRLAKPSYPAQKTPIQSLLLKLDELKRSDLIPAKEVMAQGGLKTFGLEPPRAALTLAGKDQKYSIAIGAPTPLTNQMYLQVFGSGDVYVVDSAVASYIPASAALWRNPMLLQFENLTFDTIQIRAGSRVIEIEQDATNKLWHITKPMVARADQEKIAELLQNLRLARVSGFLGDAAGADLDKFGLQTPDTVLSLSKGTNVLSEVGFGRSPANNPSLVIARKMPENALVMVNETLTALLKQPYKTFHESRLLSFNLGTLDRIEVHSAEAFSLVKSQAGWQIDGPFKSAADSRLMSDFLGSMTGLEIIDFAKDVPTEADLKKFFLAPPLLSYSLFKTQTNEVGFVTNNLITTVEFGTNDVDRIYVRRTDEAPIYITRYADMLLLPKQAFELRDRTIWNLDQTNIVGLQWVSSAETNTLSRAPNTPWTKVDVLNATLSETIFRLSKMKAVSWVSKDQARFKLYGVSEDSPKLIIQALRNGKVEQLEAAFGKRSPSGNYYASIFLPDLGIPAIFEFPIAAAADLIQIFPNLGK
jgi:hypothetical protein